MPKRGKVSMMKNLKTSSNETGGLAELMHTCGTETLLKIECLEIQRIHGLNISKARIEEPERS